MQDLKPQLTQLGYQLIAISPDRPAKSDETIQKHKLDYQLLSDSKMIGARAFSLAFQVSKEALEQDDFGTKLEDASGEKHHLLPVPSTFIVGTDGIIKFEYINPDHRMRLNPDLLLAAAKATLESSKEQQNGNMPTMLLSPAPLGERFKIKIIDLNDEYEKLYFLCLEDWSEEAKEAGDQREKWYGKMKDNGLRAKLALDDNEQVGGMIQYIPVEYSFVNGEDLYFINCIWVHGHK
ncbi:redoxin domain-containing protein, partial [Chloroflexota bacterium]